MRNCGKEWHKYWRVGQLSNCVWKFLASCVIVNSASSFGMCPFFFENLSTMYLPPLVIYQHRDRWTIGWKRVSKTDQRSPGVHGLQEVYFCMDINNTEIWIVNAHLAGERKITESGRIELVCTCIAELLSNLTSQVHWELHVLLAVHTCPQHSNLGKTAKLFCFERDNRDSELPEHTNLLLVQQWTRPMNCCLFVCTW